MIVSIAIVLPAEPCLFTSVPKSCLFLFWRGTTALLNRIKEAERQTPDRRDFLDYAVMFGGGGVLAKFALSALSIHLPVYVGFDSGDFELIST